MNNLTPTEYDAFVRQYGVRNALAQYPYTMSYRYAPDSHEWTMFYHSQEDRARFATSLRALGGIVTGASGGDVNLYRAEA